MLAEHQVDAVAQLEAMLRCGAGALLADAPGTGKTRIALAIAAAWVARGAAVEVIVPAAIRQQWAAEIRDAAIDVTLLTHDAIVSKPFVAVPDRRLVIVDEAHAFRNPATQRYDALARRTIAASVLLVTATPVCNRAGDLRALIALLAPDDALLSEGIPSIDAAFERLDFSSIAGIVERYVVRRDRSVVPPQLRFGSLVRYRVPFRVTREPLGPAIDELAFPVPAEQGFLRRLLLFRLQSSLAAFLESVRRQQRFHERALDALRNGRTLARSDYRRLFAQEDADGPVQQVLFWDAFVEAPAVRSASELEGEIAKLGRLHDFASQLVDEKLVTLDRLLSRLRQPVIIFATFIATARVIARKLRGAVLATGQSQRGAAIALDAFVRGRANVLVTTDVAAEGLNLQRAGCIVHYDVPWNPVRLDQRNGRAHRIGQARPEVAAYYFVPEDDVCGVTSVVRAKNSVRSRIERTRSREAAPFASTMRARLERGDPAERLAAAATAARTVLPFDLDRRHRAGVERLLGEFAMEGLDRTKLRDLEELVVAERSLCEGRAPL